MPTLYPPVLESKALAIQYFASPTSTDFYDIRFKLPSANTRSELKHVQVSIKYKATGESAVNNAVSPDNSVLYIDINEANGASPYFYMEDTGNYILRVPYSCFAEGRPLVNNNYIVQIRFGSCELWPGAGTGIQGAGHTGFAAWRSAATNAVPSQFGEWSNLQTVYCYGASTVETTYNLADFVPEVVFRYAPVYDDPLEQVKIYYYYNDLQGQTSDTLVFNGQYSDDGIYTVSAKIPVAPVQTIKVSVEGVTKNNTIIGGILTIPPIGATNAIGVLADGEMYDLEAPNHTPLAYEELQDGIIAKGLLIHEDLPLESHISIYRANIYTLKTIKILENLELQKDTELIFKDFTVEMGEEYQYIACVVNAYGEVTNLIVDVYDWGYNNPGYGRCTKFDAVFLTTRQHQLRLEGNVSIASLKRNTSDAFQTTLGSKYPYYTRSAETNYRSFTLSALVTINFDPTAAFMRYDTDNGLWWDEEDQSSLQILNRDLFGDLQISLSRRRMIEPLTERKEIITLGDENKSDDPMLKDQYKKHLEEKQGARTIYSRYLYKNANRLVDTSLSDRMVYLERKFRDFVMHWLSDGKPKLFRSETEGNMIVMLSGVTFSPLQGSSRMVYTFSGTVTEIAEYNLENLINYDLVPIDIRTNYVGDNLYDFTPGDEDPNVVTDLMLRYNKIFDIPDSLVNEPIKTIDLSQAVINGVKPFGFSVVNPANFPEGLTFNPATGKISGAPTVPSDYRKTVIIRVTDSNPKGAQTAEMKINVGIIYTKLLWKEIPVDVAIPGTLTNVPISSFSVAQYLTGGVKPYTFMSSTLPSGITISEDGIISGMYAFPVEPGTATIQAVDSVGQVAFANIQYGRGTYPLYFTYLERFNIPYTEANREMIPIDVSAGVTGGFPTVKNIDQYPTGYRFSQTGLPEGLTINEATGVISGKPVAATASGGTAIITAYDFGAEFDQTVSEASITISYQRVLEEFIFEDDSAYDIRPGYDPQTSPDIDTPTQIGTRIAEIDLMKKPAVTGGLPYNTEPPYRFYASGLLPDFSIDNFGKITGIARKASDPRDATVYVMDQRGQAYQRSIPIHINAITSSLRYNPDVMPSLPQIVEQTNDPNYRMTIDFEDIQGGNGDYTVSVSNIPEGLTQTMREVQGHKYLDVYGTPTRSTSGPTKGKITITDSAKPVSEQVEYEFNIGQVVPTLVWDVGDEWRLPATTAGEAIVDFSVGRIEGGIAPYDLNEETVGSLDPFYIYKPDQSEIYHNFTIEGTTPEEAMAERSVRLVLTDGAGQRLTRVLTISPNAASLTITLINSMGNDVLVVNRSTIPSLQVAQASGGITPYNFFFLKNGAETKTLIDGLTLTTLGDNAYLSGTPTQTYPRTDMSQMFRVRDGNQPTGRVAAPSNTTSWFLASVVQGLTRWDGQAWNDPINTGQIPYMQQYDGVQYILTNGLTGVVFEASAVPDGLTFNTSTGRLSGSPSQIGQEMDITITAKWPGNRYTPAYEESVQVHFGPVVSGISFVRSPADLAIPQMTLNQPITPLVISNGLSGGTMPYQWEEPIGLPAGITYTISGDNNEIFTIQGAPTATMPAGQVTFTVKDSGGNSAHLILSFGGCFSNTLTFQDSPALDIPAMALNETLLSIDVANMGLVTGGTGKYSYTAENISPYQMNAGVIQGNSGDTPQAEKTGTITVSDSGLPGVTASVQIVVGAIRDAISFEKTFDHDIPAGVINNSSTVSLSDGVRNAQGTVKYAIQAVPETWSTNGGTITVDTTGIVTAKRPTQACAATTVTVVISDDIAETSVVLNVGEVTAS